MKMREIRISIKTLVLSFIVLGLLLTSGVIEAKAADEVPIYLDEDLVEFPDAKPFIDGNGRTQVPARFIAEELGAEVSWNEALKMASFELDGIKVEVVIGESQYSINGLTYEMDTEALVKEDRTFVPARYISEALGQEVLWDSEKRAVSIEAYEEPIWLAVVTNENIRSNKGDLVKLDYETSSYEFGDALLIAIKPFAEALNGQFYVDYDGQIANARILGNDIEMKLYDDHVVVNGEKVVADTDITVQDNVYAPVSLLEGILEGYDTSIISRYDFLMKKTGSDTVEDAYGSYSEKNDVGVNHTDYYIENVPDDVEAIADSIIESLDVEGKSDYEKLVAVNDYIVKTTAYDYEKASQIINGDYSGYSGYSVLTDNTGVCQDYSVAAVVLLNKMGVETLYVVGNVSVDPKSDLYKYKLAKLSPIQYHAWNIVNIEGNYYHVDMTFNDAYTNKGNGLEESILSRYNYLLLSDMQMGEERLWQREDYPSCSETYDEMVFSQLSTSKYSTKEIVLKTDDGSETAEDIKVKLSVNGKTYNYRRMLILPKGESTISYMFIQENSEIPANQEFEESLIHIDEYDSDLGYSLDASSNGDSRVISIVSKTADNSVISTVRLAEPAKVDQAVSITVHLLKKNVGNARGYISLDSFVSTTIIKEGEREGLIALDIDFSEEDYYYKMRVSSNLKGSKLDSNYELTEEDVLFYEKTDPLRSFTVELPAEYMEEPQVVDDPEGTEVDDEVLRELRTVIMEGPFSKHSLFKEFTKIEDSLTIEKNDPVNTEDIRNYYYAEEFDSGYYIFCSYYLDEDNGAYIKYKMNINDVDVTEENYLDVFYGLVDYLGEALGSEVDTLYVYDYRSDRFMSIDDYEEDELYEIVFKGYGTLVGSKQLDNVKYSVNISGGDGDELRLGVSGKVVID